MCAAVASGLVVLALAAGCSGAGQAAAAQIALDRGREQDRKVIRSATLRVDVEQPEQAVAEVARLVSESGGFVESSSVTGDAGAFLQARVPASKLDATMDAVAALGDEQSRSISAFDVTDQYADLGARLGTSLALRGRLQALLEKATSVKDVLSIEKELTRLQADIEVMQAELARVESRVELSELAISLDRTRILGPLGYATYGFFWVIEKLFVLR